MGFHLNSTLLFCRCSSKRFPSSSGSVASATVELFRFTRCQVNLCSVGLMCFDPGLFQQVIQILHDGEEDAEMVHRLDQLAYSDFFARLKNMRYFSVQMSVRFLGLPLVGLPGIFWF